MSTWLEQFSAGLDNINKTRGAAVRGGDSKDAIYQILSARVADANTRKELSKVKSGGGGVDLGGIWGGIKSGGGRALDILSRGNYASAGMSLEGLKHGNKLLPLSGIGMLEAASKGNLDEILKAGGRGVLGKDKNTYADVNNYLDEQGKLGDTTGKRHAIGKGLLSFAEDVALDPTTYIGAGAVKGLIKGAEKATGKSIPKLGRAKNTLGVDQVLTPAEKAAADLAETGSAIVKESNSQQMLKALNKPKPTDIPELPFDVVEATRKPFGPGNLPRPKILDQLQIEGPPKAAFTVDSNGVAEFKPWQNATQRMAASASLKSLQASKTKLLTGIEARRYADDVKIEPLFKSTKTSVPEKYMEDVTETLPKKPTDEVIKEGLIDLAKKAARGPGASLKVVNAKGEKLLKAGTSPLSDAEFAKLPEAEQIRLARETPKSPGAITSIKMESIHNIIRNGGKIPPQAKDVHLLINGKPVPLAKAIVTIRDNAVAHDLFGDAETVTKQVEKERQVEKVIQSKLSPTETMAWAIRHKDILDPEDITALRRAVGLGPKAVDTVMQRIKTKVVPRNFSSVEELRAARSAKMLTDKGAATLKFRMAEAGIRNLPEIDKKIERAAAAANRALETPTKANKAKAVKAAAVATEAVDDATAASKTVTKSGEAIVDDLWTTPAVVADVESKIEKASKGNVSDFKKPRVQLAKRQADAVVNAVRKFNTSQFVEPADRAKYGFETNRGVKRTRPTPGAGLGRQRAGANKFSQLSLGKDIISSASAIVRGADVATRPALMYDTAMPMLLAAEQMIRDAGIPLILGKGKTGLPMSVHDVLAALPREFVEHYYFTPERSLGITQLADIAEQFVRHNLGQLDNASVRENVKQLIMQPMGKKGLESPLTKSMAGGNLERTVDRFMDAFTEAGPKLVDALTTNSAAAVIKVGEETKALTDQTIEAFNAIVTNPKFSAGDVMQAALKIDDTVANFAKQMPNQVSPEALVGAEQAVAAHAAETLPMASVATAAKGADKFAKATTTSQAARVSEQLAASADVEGHALMRTEQINTLDLGIAAEFGSGVGFFRAFAPHLGNEMLRPILTERMSVAQSLAKQFTGQLAKIHAAHSKEDLVEAFARLQQGDEIETPAMADIQKVMKELFNTNGSQYGLISRNGISAEHLRTKFKHFGIGDNVKLDAKNIDESWKQWHVNDPLDFMSRFHAAVSSAVAERQMGADISRMFGRTTPLNDGTKWVKIIDHKGESKIATLIDKEKFFPEDIARQMHMIDKTMHELARPSASNKFLRILDSAMHSYKAGVTIYRPGHHVRNLVGDMWLADMDGVPLNAYKRATAVLGTRKSQYADFDALRSLQDAYAVKGAAPKSVLNLTYKGKKISLSPDEVYRMAFDSGALPDYSVLEDIAFGATQQADTVAESLKKFSPLRVIGKEGSIHKAAAKTSEYRDHYVRIAHFLHAMEDGGALKGATLEEALKNASHVAGSRVRKWHPDGSDLSYMEKNVMRRTILFYSWVRKAIPLVLESAVTRPGKVLIYPKVMQNMAAANGIDLEGLGNPFPTDQLFPSYIADSVQGPQFGEPGAYAGIKPGIPSMDVADDYFTDPMTTLRTIMGGTNPGLKIPFELATGNQVRTGTPIMDKTDYVDAQIPGANYLGKLAGGKSPSSGFTQDTRVSSSNQGYEGNPNLPSKGLTDFLNWLSGMGITDYSKPSSIKSAQLEARGKG